MLQILNICTQMNKKGASEACTIERNSQIQKKKLCKCRSHSYLEILLFVFNYMLAVFSMAINKNVSHSS